MDITNNPKNNFSLKHRADYTLFIISKIKEV